jgi:histidinol-phosphate aminotransferase
MSLIDMANEWISGLTTYEPGRPIEEVARELGFENVADITKLASNENALGPSPKAIRAIKESAVNMHRYPDGGCYYLKQALAKKLGVPVEQVLPVNGSNEAIELLAHAFLRAGTGIVMAECAFVVYRLIAEVFRASVATAPMKAFTHDLGAMLEAVTPETRIVFISNPNNPTGTMVGQKDIDDFMAKVPDHVVVCFDEAYIELLQPDLKPDVLKYVRDGRHVVLLRTLSKSYGLAGLRIGYAVAPEECIDLMNKMRQPFNVNAVAAAAAVAALGDEAHLERTREMTKQGLKYFEQEFRRLGLDYVPAVANFMLVDVGGGRRVFEAMQKEGVIVRAMDCYNLPNHVRITVGTYGENELCIEVLERVMKGMR